MKEIKEYQTHTIASRLFSGTLDTDRLFNVLNEYAEDGYTLRSTLKEEVRVLFFFRREAHHFIFERVIEVES